MKTPADGWDPGEREALRDLEQELELVRERHRSDPPIELLLAARAEVLPEELQGDVGRYLAEDAWSRALIDGASHDESTLDSAQQDHLFARIHANAAESPRRPLLRRWLSRPVLAGAAAVLIVSLGLFAWRNRSLPTEEARPPERIVRTAPAPAPSFHLPLEAPRVRLSTAVLTWRGRDEKNHVLAALKPGMDAFRKGDYRTADAELSKVAAAYPDVFDVRYYQGVSRLLVEDNAGAIESLNAADRMADSSFAPDVAWYLAVAYARAGQIDDARKRLTSVCQAGASHAAEACAAIQQLR